MNRIISAVPVEELEKELARNLLIHKTRKGDNLIYSFTSEQAPALMKEVGRLRELSFRSSGGGTGKELDIDELDLIEGGYRQMIVWNPKDKAIVGGYRYIIPRCRHPKYLSTEHYFEFSDIFREKYLPWTIELGRSFVQPKYQRSIYALDNLWDGVVSIFALNPDVQYCFGKITMYGDYNRQARDLIIYFLKKHFPDTENLMKSKYPVDLKLEESLLSKILCGKDFKEDYKILKAMAKKLAGGIPPLFNSYMNLSPTMKVFDTAINNDFGDVEETGILVTINDIFKDKLERHYKF